MVIEVWHVAKMEKRKMHNTGCAKRASPNAEVNTGNAEKTTHRNVRLKNVTIQNICHEWPRFRRSHLLCCATNLPDLRILRFTASSHTANRPIRNRKGVRTVLSHRRYQNTPGNKKK